MSAKDFKQHMLNELRKLERLIRNGCAQDNGEFDSYEPEELKWLDKLHEMQELCEGKNADASTEPSINYDGVLAAGDSLKTDEFRIHLTEPDELKIVATGVGFDNIRIELVSANCIIIHACS